MIKGVIFDMDGVITDNNPYHEKAWAQFCRRYDVILTEDEVHRHIFGRVAKDTLEYIFRRQLTKEEISNYVEQKENIYRQLYKDYIVPVNGLISLLDSLKARGIKLAMATSAPPGNVEFTFRHIPIRNYFSVILDAEAIQKGKPDPEIYVKAINLLELEPTECIIFEDSLPGIQSALASGAYVIGVATTHGKEKLKAVHGVISDFTEVDESTLINHAGHNI